MSPDSTFFQPENAKPATLVQGIARQVKHIVLILWLGCFVCLSLLVFDYFEEIWSPNFGVSVHRGLLALWGSQLLLLATIGWQISLPRLIKALWFFILAGCWFIVSGWGWNDWQRKFAVNMNVALDQTMFLQLSVAAAFGWMATILVLRLSSVENKIRGQAGLVFWNKYTIAVALSSLLVAHFSTFLELRSNGWLRLLVHLWIFAISACSCYYVTRAIHSNGQSLWSIMRTLAFYPAFVLTVVVINQNDTTVTLPVALITWVTSVYLTTPMLAGLIPPIAHRFTNEPTTSQSPQTSRPIPSPLRLGFAIGVAIVALTLMTGMLQFMSIRKSARHLAQEFRENWQYARVVEVLNSHNIEFRSSPKKRLIKSLVLHENVPPDVFSQVSPQIDLAHSFQIRRAYPHVDMSLLPARLLQLNLTDSTLDQRQVVSFLEKVSNGFGFSGCSINKSTEVIRPSRVTPWAAWADIWLESCSPGSLANLIEIFEQANWQPPIHVVRCELNRDDFLALDDYPGLVRLYFEAAEFASFLDVASENQGLDPSAPPRNISVGSGKNWSPEQYPHLWQQILSGRWNVRLPQEDIENSWLAIWASHGEVLGHSDPTGGKRPDRSRLWSAVDLRRFSWTHSSQTAADLANTDFDCLWLPRLTSVLQIEPDITPAIRHLSFRRQLPESPLFEHLDDEKIAIEFLADLPELESLDLAGLNFRNNAVVFAPLPKLEQLTVELNQLDHIRMLLPLLASPQLKQLTILNSHRGVFPGRFNLMTLPPALQLLIVEKVGPRNNQNRADLLAALPTAQFLTVEQLSDHLHPVWAAHREFLRAQIQQRIDAVRK